MSDKITQVEVKVLGKTHQFTCTEGQENLLLDAAELLNKRVNTMKQRSSIKNEQNALLMAALYLCYDLQSIERKQNSEYHQHKTLIDKIQAVIDTP